MEDNFITLHKDDCLNVKEVRKILNWAFQRNTHRGSTNMAQYAKAVREVGELGDALLKNNKDDVEDAIGDTSVVLINLAEMCQTDLQTCLDRTYEQIKDRHGVMFNGVL